MITLITPSDEQEHTQREIERIKQAPDEQLALYNHRLRDITDLAYPTATRNLDQQKIFIKHYAHGLREDQHAKKSVEHFPRFADIEEAMTFVGE